MNSTGKAAKIRAQNGPISLFVGIAALSSLPTVVMAADNVPASSVKVALLSMKTGLGEFKLGGPVVVSRQDIESPLARVRSPELNLQIDGGAKASDPVFKGVYLTPRENTGRPSLLPPIPVEEPPVATIGKTDKPGTYTTASFDPVVPPPEKPVPPGPAVTKPKPDPVIEKTKVGALSEPEPKVEDDRRVTKRPPVARPPQPPKLPKAGQRPAKTADAPAAKKFSKPEIEATRAFSRM